MRLASGTSAAAWCVFSLTVMSACPAWAYPRNSGLSARWVGQDGHDYVSPHNRLEPSDVQDMHIILSGLDPAREVVYIDVKVANPIDEWEYNAQSFSWKAELKREKGSPTADLFLEPGHIEIARNYHILIRYDDNSTHEIDVRGSKVNHSLRMPSVAIQARWVGQDRHDRVGTGPSVGPDGIQDIRIRLAGVSTRVQIKAMRIDGAGVKWETGANPQLLPSAEFWPDPQKHGEGDLFLQPERDLRGMKLRIRVFYANDTVDSTSLTAPRFDPKLRMPSTPPPRIAEFSAKAEWLGQDGQDVTGPGDVHVRLALSRIPSFVAAVLTDSVRGTWVYRVGDRVKSPVSGAEVSGPLVVRPGGDRGAIDLFFAPYRDETGASCTLRLVDQEGRMAVARFVGGSCDPALRSAQPSQTTAQANPGDDLNALANQHGTVTLAPGTYRMVRPLVLDHPVTLKSDGKATLLFSQAPNEKPWTTAIKIHCGNTTLDGFAVRFDGPVRWDQDVSYGPAVIGTTDNRDQGHNDFKANITLTRLDLEGPPAVDPSKWVEATRLVRFTNAHGGLVAGNILRGGSIEFFDGPWQFLKNDFRGTAPGTFSHGVFTGHGTYDVLVRGNRAKPVEPGGKSWRFLVLTHRGSNDRIEDNVIEDVGARDLDTIPWSNEPEIILTEAYHLIYEGKLAALSSDGRLLRTYHPQGEEAATGDVVSLLSGPAAGQYRRIAQVIDSQTYLVDSLVPKGTEIVSISRGFVGETFERNTIDMRRGKKSCGFILAGNHFAVRVAQNHVLGGNLALALAACPSETPVIWGWSHVPVLGAVVEDNTFEDCVAGALFNVEHNQNIKTNKGRTYMSLTLSGNLVRWSEGFLRRLKASGGAVPPPGLTVGNSPSHDPSELVVKAARNHLDAPASARAGGSLIVHAAEYNSHKFLERKYSLPPATGASTGRSLR
ncbi:MAG: hypothetical protein ACP5XB_29080 [Isosphaeraceae bacterium]